MTAPTPTAPRPAMPQGATPPASHPTIRIGGTTYFIDDALCELRNVRNAHEALRFRDPTDLRRYPAWERQLQGLLGRRVTRAEVVYDETLYCWVPRLTFNDGQTLSPGTGPLPAHGFG